MQGAVLNNIFSKYFLQYNFIKDEMFEEETFTSKNTAKFKDFTSPKHISSEFFLSIKFYIKKNFNNNRTL